MRIKFCSFSPAAPTYFSSPFVVDSKKICLPIWEDQIHLIRLLTTKNQALIKDTSEALGLLYCGAALWFLTAASPVSS